MFFNRNIGVVWVYKMHTWVCTVLCVFFYLFFETFKTKKIWGHNQRTTSGVVSPALSGLNNPSAHPCEAARQTPLMPSRRSSAQRSSPRPPRATHAARAPSRPRPSGRRTRRNGSRPSPWARTCRPSATPTGRSVGSQRASSAARLSSSASVGSSHEPHGSGQRVTTDKRHKKRAAPA